MFNIDKTAIIIAFLVGLLVGMAAGAYADDVKYCRDARTGQIITVEAGQPCPFPTHDL
jgi:hypothetical protein